VSGKSIGGRGNVVTGWRRTRGEGKCRERVEWMRRRQKELLRG
jgi:hypothetical protein